MKRPETDESFKMYLSFATCFFFSYHGTHIRVTQGEPDPMMLLQTRGQLSSAITLPVLCHEARQSMTPEQRSTL